LPHRFRHVRSFERQHHHVSIAGPELGRSLNILLPACGEKVPAGRPRGLKAYKTPHPTLSPLARGEGQTFGLTRQIDNRIETESNGVVT